MTPSQAFAAVALAAVACDGTLGRDEARALRSQLEFRSPYRNLDEKAMGDLFDGLLSQLRQSDWRTLLREAIPALDPAQQETCLAMAAQLVRCDRVVQPAEEELLEQLASEFSLDEARAAQILDVIAVLNRDSLAG
ncbi:tellurite resistance TerB family protein [Synechococcus sp. CS-1328]|uniref:tellurite resistance TerB family protein n=1 Tax=Synechococcus sp. CS-1328 TaxID=2847976 RepID=UPI00223B5CAB|nr:tellurite resistance TerB family protein [Synechococcus sp. CS-1328]MCT0226329.1 tellurite resistance TerB family protein [Synechococcus sp. CS-1328]